MSLEASSSKRSRVGTARPSRRFGDGFDQSVALLLRATRVSQQLGQPDLKSSARFEARLHEPARR